MGVDPGSLRTGFGVVAHDGERAIHVAHGTIVLDSKKDIAGRLADLARDLTTLLEKYQPSSAVVEDVFFFKNARSALVLGQARGAALAVLGLHSISITSYNPTTVKSLIAGRGHALKFQVAALVALELAIPIPSSKDASDALALALAGARSS